MLFGGGELGWSLEQGADAVELDALGGMEPAEAADAMETERQDMLEEAADELEGLEVDMTPGAGAAVAERPTQSALGQELELPVAGGGFEDVTAQVA